MPEDTDPLDTAPLSEGQDRELPPMPEQPVTDSQAVIFNQSELKPSNSIGSFLDNIYGALFTPAKTFEALRSHPSMAQAISALVLVNALEGLRIGRSPAYLPLIVIPGLVGWFIFTSLLKSLAEVFQHKIGLQELLTLTAFGSMPWIFMGPALSLASPTRIYAAIAVMIWFVVWQVWAASVAIGTTSWRLLSVIPLAIAGGIVSLVWLGNLFKLMFSVF
ncbi:YIP1 family protein [Tumidithrix helvetica PCC 7403]|uniref:YIP1 family protein n=1 Tax=Tumidithrix helvetica TaxID=3457545 RepID=UPI003CA1BE67